MARAAAGILLLQAVLLAVASVVLAVEGFDPETVDRLGAEILALIGLASAVGLALLGGGVARSRRWARTPVVVLELIALPIAGTIVQNDKWFAGVPLGISALAVLVLMATSGQLVRSD
jgi:hypothetical protein